MSATRAMAAIVVPIYFASLGYRGFALGLLYSLSALVSAVLTALIGSLSDRAGRKPFLVAAPLLTTLAWLAFLRFRSPLPLFAFAALGSLGRGAGAGAGMIGPHQAAEQAFLTAKVSHRERNALFGRMAFASSLGALFGAGPLIALASLVASGRASLEYRIEFFIGAALALLPSLLALPLGEEPRPGASARRTKWESEPRKSGMGLSGTSRSILYRLWITNGVNGLAVGFFGPLITYWFHRRFGATTAQIGLLYALVNLASLLSNLSSARIASRFGIVRTIVTTRVFQAALILPMIAAPGFWLAGTIYLVRMMVQRIGLPLRQSFVMGVVPDEERGRVGALSNLPSQMSSALGPAAAGYLFEELSMAAPFVAGALLQGLNAGLFYLFFRAIRPPEEGPETPATETASGG